MLHGAGLDINIDYLLQHMLCEHKQAKGSKHETEQTCINRQSTDQQNQGMSAAFIQYHYSLPDNEGIVLKHTTFK
jgi:hypothetical protein